jgi:hypothetical protein
MAAVGLGGWFSNARDMARFKDPEYGPDSDQLLGLREIAVNLPEELRHIAQRYEGANLLGGTAKDRMKDELLLLTLLAGQPPPGTGEATEFSI